jgi:hypothetical protein
VVLLGTTTFNGTVATVNFNAGTGLTTIGLAPGSDSLG